MRIKTKLIGTLVILIVALMSIGTYQFVTSSKIQEKTKEMLEIEQMRVTLKSIQYRLTGISNDERAFLLTGKAEYPQEIKKKAMDITTYLTQLNTLSASLSEDNQGIEEIKKQYQAYITASEHMISTYNHGDKTQAAQIHFQEERTIRKKGLDPAVDNLVKTTEKQTQEHLLTLQTIESNQRILLGSVISVLIVSGLMIGFVILRSIIQPLYVLRDRLSEIAEGGADLSQRIVLNRRDELGDVAASFNKMVSNLQHLIQQFEQNAKLVASTSQEVAASVEQTNQATEQITLAVQEIATGLDRQVDDADQAVRTVSDISQAIKEATHSIETVAEITLSAEEKSSSGTNLVQQTLTQLHQMQQSVQATAGVINGLGEKAEEITTIIGIMSEIAAQTNLLALNAAIEAARAGEHGKGFSIVADEVRKLAEQSSTAADQIQSVIQGIQNETKHAIASMHTGTQAVETGLHMAEQTGSAFHSIADTINKIKSCTNDVVVLMTQVSEYSQTMLPQITEISHLSEESSGMNQQVVAATEEQTASMEEITASVSQLHHMSQELHRLTHQFKF